MGFVDDIIYAARFIVEYLKSFFTQGHFIPDNIRIDIEVSCNADALAKLNFVVKHDRFTRPSLHVNSSCLTCHDLIFGNENHVLRHSSHHYGPRFKVS